MNTLEQLAGYPYLKQVVLSYAALGLTDIIHHLHVTYALGIPSGMHAVIIGVILFPATLIATGLLARYKKNVFLWSILTVAVITTVIPGMYHGGWAHVWKLLAAYWIDNESTNLSQLLPSDNAHLWFYEMSGVLEFFMALICAYYLYQYSKSHFKQRRALEQR